MLYVSLKFKKLFKNYENGIRKLPTGSFVMFSEDALFDVPREVSSFSLLMLLFVLSDFSSSGLA